MRSSSEAVALLGGLRWPLPALLAWTASWLVFAALSAAGTPTWAAAGAAVLLGLVLAPLGATPWRRALIAGGFPASLAASGLLAGLPPWAWLLPLAALALLYPLRSWADAPVFPTPHGALRGLAHRVALAPGARILDAGCGLGDGLRELRREYPRAVLEGVEWSLPLACLARLRCPWAGVRRGDLWRADWSAFALVYLFQRPESMPRAVAKAAAELAPGAWMASLEFEAGELRARHVHVCADGRRVWLYQAPLEYRRGS